MQPGMRRRLGRVPGMRPGMRQAPGRFAGNAGRGDAAGGCCRECGPGDAARESAVAGEVPG